MCLSLSTFLSLYSSLPPLSLSLSLPPPPPTRLAAEPSHLALPPTWEPRVPHLHPPYSTLLPLSDCGSL